MPKMVAFRALVFRPLVKGNEALGTKLWERDCDNVSSFCHWGSKTFCLVAANLTTQKNVTRNNVS